MRKRFDDLRACYQKGLATKPDLGCNVAVRFTIGRDGSTSTVSATGDLPDEAVKRCIAAAFQTFSFPEPDGGVITATYPLSFSP